MERQIVRFEDLECLTHGLCQHWTQIHGHVSCCFGPDDVPPPEHGVKEIYCMQCLKLAWEGEIKESIQKLVVF